MLSGLIRWSLKNRAAVLLLSAVLILGGIYSASRVPLDVFPEFAPPQVLIQTEAPGFSPEEVESLITIPLESVLNGTPQLEAMRSSSAIGISVIKCIFEPDADLYRARQLIAERLQLARGRLPVGAREPEMGPITSPIGNLLEITLRAETTSLSELRSLVDWTLRRRLLAVPGVAQVVVMGGEVKQYQVIVDPERLNRYRISLTEVLQAAAASNQNVGAGFVEGTAQRLVIQGVGRVRSPEDIASAVIAVRNGVPVTIGQVAQVQFGPAYKIGDASEDSKPAVLLIIIKQPWANTLTVTQELEKVLGELRQGFPPDVHEVTAFRQASFIERAVRNVNYSMLEGGLLVVAVLVLFLSSGRAALISLTAIPLSLLVAVIVLERWGATINMMTLGGLAIAIGEVVDDAIIDVENIHRRLRLNREREHPEPALLVVYRASMEVRASVVFATLIVALVLLPVFSLSGLAGSIFRPLGIAYIAAILASMLVALTLTPALAALLLPSTAGRSGDTPLVRRTKAAYGRVLEWALDRTRAVFAVSLALAAGALLILPHLGGEFLPDFNEGNLIIVTHALPGTPLAESLRVGGLIQQDLKQIPEAAVVAQFSGRAELHEETEGPDFSEIFVRLKEEGRPIEEVLSDIRRRLAKYPGFQFSVKQYIAEHVEDVLSGALATVAVRIYGDDLQKLNGLARAVEAEMGRVAGVTDLAREAGFEVPRVQLRFNRQRLAEYGISTAHLADTLSTAFFGKTVSTVLEGQRQYALFVRYHPDAARDPEAIRRTLVDTPAGEKVPLGTLAEVAVVNGVGAIKHENALRRTDVECNVAGRDLNSVVEDIRSRLRNAIRLPAGYYIEYGGQYAEQQHARRQIFLLGAAALAGIVVLLWLAFRSFRWVAIVLANLPFALVGGVVAALLAGGSLSISSLVGFITLFGVALRNGIMLLTHYQHLLAEEGETLGRGLVIRGAMERVSPILMTALTAGLALLPLVIGGDKPGREIQHPMAVVIVGGLFSSTLLNLVVLPALFLRYGHRLAASQPTAVEELSLIR